MLYPFDFEHVLIRKPPTLFGNMLYIWLLDNPSFPGFSLSSPNPDRPPAPSGVWQARRSTASYPKYLSSEVEILFKRPGGTGMGDGSAIQHIGAVRQGQDDIEIVLDDDDGRLLAQIVQYRE